MASSWTQERLSVGSATFDWFTPPNAPRFGMIFLLDTDGKSLTGSPTYIRLLQRFNLACVALPPCPSWWSDRPCAAFHPRLSAEQFILQEVLPLFRERWN